MCSTSASNTLTKVSVVADISPWNLKAINNVAAGWSEEVCVSCETIYDNKLVFDNLIVTQTPDCAYSIALAYPG